MRMSDGKERKKSILLALPFKILASFSSALFKLYQLEHRPGCSETDRASFQRWSFIRIRSSTPLRLHPLLFLLESMRRDVRILLVGDGPSIPFSSLVSKLKVVHTALLRGCR